MGDNLIHNLTLLRVIVRANLRRQRQLLVIVVIPNNIEVDASRLAVEHTGGATFFAKVDLRTVKLVKQHRGDRVKHLERKVLGLDNIDAGDELIDDERETVSILDCDGVGFSADDNGGAAAFGDEDGVADRRLDLDCLLFVVFLSAVSEGSDREHDLNIQLSTCCPQAPSLAAS
jgi:hypothetical protein